MTKKGSTTAIRRVGVIGAGTMGHGIAQVCAVSGFETVLHDLKEDLVAEGRAKIEGSLEKLTAKGKLGDGVTAEALGRLETTTRIADLAGCDLIVEAATENPAIKQTIFRNLSEAHGKSSAIFATNTSSIPITLLAAATDRPERFIGMHFMNPVPIVPLVEIIRGEGTSDATHAVIVATAEKLGKTPVTVNDYPGFVSNRVLMPMINEAVYCVMEGVAEPEAIDQVMKLGMNHPMGPLALADLIGLDTCLAILEVLHEGLGEDKYRPCPLLRRKVQAGHLGRKTGRGFYVYDA